MSAAQAKSQDQSMDEILASIRRIIADDAEPAREPTRPSSPHHPDNDDVLDLADVEPAASAADLDIEIPEIAFREPEPEPVRTSSAAAFRDPIIQPPSESEVAQPVPDAPAMADPLVSNQTTASVSHAFNLLSHTILTQNARTLEDLVREMLKPMLKTWLDDNLPPLVERLVRSEIERVARGNR